MSIRVRPSAFGPEIAVGDVYPSEAHKEALRRLQYLAEARGIGLLTGEAGLGKTIAIRTFIPKLAPSSYLVLYTHIKEDRSPLRPVVENLLTQLGERIPFNNTCKSLGLLQEALQSSYERGRSPFLVFDDFHLLEPRGLLQLKALTNYQMDSCPFMSLLLTGASSRVLNIRELEEVRQRLLFGYPFRPLRKEEVEPYVQHRLKAAGYENPVFPRDVIDELYLYSQGNPRLLNQLARLCLMAAATERKDLVDRSCLLQAVAEVRAIGANPGPDAPSQEV